ncbi:MAG: response regulator [bacterium]
MKRIVIADDTKTARMFIQKCLQIAGVQEAEFVEAANGREALEKVKEAPTDLLLTDHNMPVMDGMTLLKWVKASPKLTELPVIVITSASNAANDIEFKNLGALEVLSKPITPADLYPIIQPLLFKENDP